MPEEKDFEKEKDLLETCRRHAQPSTETKEIKMDDNLYLLNEIVRIYYSNKFATPTDEAVLKTLLEEHIEYLLVQDPEKVNTIMGAMIALGAVDPKELTSKVFK